MTTAPLDLAALARETMVEMMVLIGADRPWGDAVERLITAKLELVRSQSHAASRAEGLEEAAKDIDELLSQADPLNFNSILVRAAWQDRAWAILKKWRALASSDPRDQVADFEPCGECPETMACISYATCGHAAGDFAGDERSDDPAPAPPVEPGLAAQEVERLRAVVEAAKQMPRATLHAGGTGDVQLYPIESGVVWDLDRALKALSAPRPAQTKGPTE